MTTYYTATSLYELIEILSRHYDDTQVVTIIKKNRKWIAGVIKDK